MRHATLGSQAAIATLITLQVIMLASLMTKTAPHPPLAVAPFAMAPFLGCSIAVAVAAFVLAPCNSRTSFSVAVFAAVLALVSYGPQKWLDAAIPQIWPAVLTGQLAAVAVIWCAYQALRLPEADGA